MIKNVRQVFDVSCHVCALFAVNTWLTVTATERDTTDVIGITTRIAIDGTIGGIGAIAGTIRTDTTTTGGMDGVTGHIATEERKLFNRICIRF